MQKVVLLVDAYTTDNEDWDAPLSIQQLIPGCNVIPQPEGTKRYRVNFLIPKTITPTDGDIVGVGVINEVT